jgi:hypothetical protein
VGSGSYVHRGRRKPTSPVANKPSLGPPWKLHSIGPSGDHPTRQNGPFGRLIGDLRNHNFHQGRLKTCCRGSQTSLGTGGIRGNPFLAVQ